MPKGHEQFKGSERAVLRAIRALTKIQNRVSSLLIELDPYAKELAARPVPVAAPKPAGKVQQLKLPGVKRKAAKVPAKRKRA